MNKIEAKNVDFYYGDFHALKNINITIPNNEVVAFIGPSGCGKSTFLRLFNRMNDLIPGTRLTGEIDIDGRNIYDPSVNVDILRKNVGMVFQRPNPFPKSIFENVAYGLRVNGIKDKDFITERVETALKGAALWNEVKDKLKASAYDLSGGQQQRLCIARAMAVEPSVLLMDEPASALDPISTSKIEELICELSSQTTVVIVTHSMQQTRPLSSIWAKWWNMVKQRKSSPAPTRKQLRITSRGVSDKLVYNNMEKRRLTQIFADYKSKLILCERIIRVNLR